MDNNVLVSTVVCAYYFVSQKQKIMKEKRLYWCPFCHRNVSLWETKNGEFLCPRCGREILEVTDDGKIVTIKGKDSLNQ